MTWVSIFNTPRVRSSSSPGKLADPMIALINRIHSAHDICTIHFTCNFSLLIFLLSLYIVTSNKWSGGTSLLLRYMKKIVLNVLDAAGSKLSIHDQKEPFQKRAAQIFIAGSRLFGFQKVTMNIHQPDSKEGI